MAAHESAQQSAIRLIRIIGARRSAKSPSCVLLINDNPVWAAGGIGIGIVRSGKDDATDTGIGLVKPMGIPTLAFGANVVVDAVRRAQRLSILAQDQL